MERSFALATVALLQQTQGCLLHRALSWSGQRPSLLDKACRISRFEKCDFFFFFSPPQLLFRDAVHRHQEVVPPPIAMAMKPSGSRLPLCLVEGGTLVGGFLRLQGNVGWALISWFCLAFQRDPHCRLMDTSKKCVWAKPFLVHELRTQFGDLTAL